SIRPTCGGNCLSSRSIEQMTQTSFHNSASPPCDKVPLPVVAVEVERRGSVGWIVLTRADQINAINDDIRRGVPAALAELDGDPSVRVIAIRGAGERGFCAGADIKERRGAETSVQVRRRMQKSRWIEALDRTEKPVIAAIHGYC